MPRRHAPRDPIEFDSVEVEIREPVPRLVKPGKCGRNVDCRLLTVTVRRRVAGTPWTLLLTIPRRLGLGTAGDDLGQLTGGVEAGESHEHLATAARTTVDQRHAPACGERAENVLERVDRAHRPARQRHHLVVIPQPTPVRVGRFENVGDHHPSIVGRRDGRPEGGMIDEPPTFEAAEKLAELVR
jgi:hypothetical protein